MITQSSTHWTLHTHVTDDPLYISGNFRAERIRNSVEQFFVCLFKLLAPRIHHKEVCTSWYFFFRNHEPNLVHLKIGLAIWIIDFITLQGNINYQFVLFESIAAQSFSWCDILCPSKGCLVVYTNMHKFLQPWIWQ